MKERMENSKIDGKRNVFTYRACKGEREMGRERERERKRQTDRDSEILRYIYIYTLPLF